MDLDDEIDALYAGDRDDFVPARDELAKRLRKDGDREAADRVKALRKPTVAAWAVDRLARDEADDVQALLESVDELRDAQQDALGGDPARFREASAAHREILDRLVGAAARALGDEGTAATVDKVRETLQAAPVDEETREDLARGRLTKELSGGAFDLGSFADVPLKKRPAKKGGAKRARAGSGAAAKGGGSGGAAPAKGRAKPREGAKPARSDTSRRDLRKARAELEAARKRAEAAERRHERAQAAFFAAEEKRDEARRALEDALSERDGLEATVRRLERE
jgi:hypothetical protein